MIRTTSFCRSLILRKNSQKHSFLSRAISSSGKESYCLDLVRKHDYENFLCTLLLPDTHLRTSLFAVRAFNTEISLVRDQVSQKETGYGRLIFWRDTVNQVFQAQQSKNLKLVPRHPVAIELSRTVMENNVSKKWFVNLVDGREKIMTDTPFHNLNELEAYCDQSFTPIIYIGLEILGVKSVDVDHAASHLGKAIGLSTFIRSLPYNAQRRRVLIPQELMAKHKVSQETFIRAKEKEKIQDLIFELASQANSYYEKAQSLKKSINNKALPLFLSGIPANMYLKRLQKTNFDPYDPSLSKRNGLLPFHLYYNKVTRRF